jgi:hypothetical protein
VTRVYENRGFWWRQTLSLAAVILVAIYGGWELWSATYSTAEYNSPVGQLFGIGDDRYLFGFIFLGGGLYAIWQLINDSSDTVATLDVDEATGASVVTLWRPFYSKTLAANVSAIRDWRFHVKIGNRNIRTYLIYADHPEYPRPLQFDLRRADVEGLRKFAGEAVAEFERATKPPSPAAKA